MKTLPVLALIAVVVMGCGPYGSSRVGQTCDAGARVQHCASPTSYAACDTTGSFAVWREYPCAEVCAEGGKCALSASKAGGACPASWQAVATCKAPQVAIGCVNGTWEVETCGQCPANTTCFSCGCDSAVSRQGQACDSGKEPSVCEVDGKVTSCVQGVWRQSTCSACRAGQPLTNCSASTGLCSCD